MCEAPHDPSAVGRQLVLCEGRRGAAAPVLLGLFLLCHLQWFYDCLRTGGRKMITRHEYSEAGTTQWSPKRNVHVPEPVSVALFWGRVFAGVIKLRL